MVASPHEAAMSSATDARLMIKHVVDNICNSILPSGPVVSAEAEIEHTLYQLAYSWTHDAQQADRLVSLVLPEVDPATAEPCDQDDLRLYARLFRRWCLFCNDPSIGDGYVPARKAGQSEQVFLQRCVSCLPKYQRVVLSLVDIAELSYCEVSAIVDVDEQTIRSWLTAARTRLLRQMHPGACS